MNNGIYAWTRNPIHTGLDLLATGSFLITGRLILLGLAVIIVGMLDYQIRREEGFLLLHYGDAYRDYCGRVGRYFRLHSS